MRKQFEVGDKVWRFDPNRRIFVEDTIINETSRSWIVGCYNDKFSKRDPQGLFTDQQKADYIWFHDNRWKIAGLVDRCQDIEKMRKIAQIVGYVE